MNRKNLQRMADYIRTVPKRQFSMDLYRGLEIDMQSPKCNSVGCVIGHCTILDADLFDCILQKGVSGIYVFSEWSRLFAGLLVNSPEWDWCFNYDWVYCDNTPTGAADRIEWLLNNGLPENWLAQMLGDEPLCYKK